MGPWTTEAPLLLRYAIGDIDTPQTYSDSRLELQFLIAAQMVRSEVNLTNSYTIDITSIYIDPDPFLVATRDNVFIALSTLKGSCMIATNESRIRGGQSISIKDGSSAISTSDRAKISQTIAKDFCDAYEKLRWEYVTGQLTDAPARFKAVISPFRFQVGGNSMGSYGSPHLFNNPFINQFGG